MSSKGNSDLDEIVRQFLKTPYVAALEQKDKATVRLYELMSLLRPDKPRRDGTQDMYNPNDFGKAKERLERLRKSLLSNEDSCPILYLGRTNNLRRRFEELVWGGHTANHAVWPLLMAKWELDYGWRESLSYSEDETELKELYRSSHNGSLPPFMKI